MTYELKTWIDDVIDLDFSSCHFCSSIGTVYLGIKPAEILNVSKERFNKCTLLKNKLKFKVISINNGSYKLFVYSEKELYQTLNKKTVIKYMSRLGYSNCFDLDKYVDTLISKIRSHEEFPHEIGFFLGYPIKDVLGFMGLVNLPLNQGMGWKVYGNLEMSLKYYEEVKTTKDSILDYAIQSQQLIV